jgi:3-hydroxy-5-methyl-1-naphthoate 3-O-methyltransferase
VTPAPPPARLLELATGHQRARILFALIRLEVPTLLAEGPRSLAEIAGALRMDGLAAHRFLHACAELGLLVRDGDGFRNAPETQRYLVRGAPAYVGDVFAHHERAVTSRAWGRLDRRLRAWRAGGTRRKLVKESEPTPEEAAGHHRMALLAGDALADAVDFSGHRRLLDLGGGTGGMSIALCLRFPALEAIVFELPAVARRARAEVAASGADRVEVREGDFLTDPWPSGGDVVLLANVLSMLDAEANRALLARVFAYLPPGGTVVLSGWMLDDDGTGPLLPVLFCLEDIVLDAPDVERSVAQYVGWLARAGFAEIAHGIYFDPTRYIAARKPR